MLQHPAYSSHLAESHSLGQLVQLFIILDCQQNVSWQDPHPLVVSGSVPSKLQYLRSEVLQDSRHVDSGALSNPLGNAALFHLAVLE